MTPPKPGQCECALRNVGHTHKCLAARLEQLERWVESLLGNDERRLGEAEREELVIAQHDDRCSGRCDRLTYEPLGARITAAVERILAARAAAPDALRERMETLANTWMRNESLSADYQDGLADCAEQLRAALAGPTNGASDE